MLLYEILSGNKYEGNLTLLSVGLLLFKTSKLVIALVVP